MGQTLPDLLLFITNYTSGTYQEQEVETVLTQLKTLGRNQNVSNQFTSEILNTLISKFVLPPNDCIPATFVPKEPPIIVIESLTVIANALIINTSLLEKWHPNTQLFYYLLQLCDRIEVDEANVKNLYLFYRLLFLLTFKKFTPYASCQSDLLKRSTEVIDKKISHFEKFDLNIPMPKLAFIEFLKFFFNIVHFHPDEVKFKDSTFKVLISDILVHRINKPTSENFDISRYIFNVLMCLPAQIWFENALVTVDARKDALGAVLAHCRFLTEPDTKDLYMTEVALSPALTCLQLIVSYLWSNSTVNSDEIEELKKLTRTQLFPTSEDRRLGVGQATTSSLASRFVALTSESTLFNTNRIAQEIYWQMCNFDADEVTSIMGFGFGSAYLTSTFLNGGDKSTKSDTKHPPKSSRITEVTDKYKKAPVNINPITGQYKSVEDDAKERAQLRAEWDALSNAEKQQESEKLYGLFEKLKKNGIFQVQNNPFDSSNLEK